MILKQLLYKGEKVDIECKEAESGVSKSVYESYSAFANTKGGYIILGVKEDKKKTLPKDRFIIQGITNPQKHIEDFWNTINSSKVNINILKDEDVFTVEDSTVSLVVIKVPRADYKMRPVYVGENPYKGTYKRNNEGDYHVADFEVDSMIRDRNPDGNDGMIFEYYTMDDIDKETLRKYRQIFEIRNDGHVWNTLDDKLFLEKLGGYRKDRREGKEGLTLAGLMMFGDGLAIRDEFDNVFMDYRDESEVTLEVRWNDRITYDGTWENNLFNFFMKVMAKLTADLKKPFKLEGIQRIDETSIHKAVREAFVNLIIHADYLLDAGTLKVVKRAYEFEFTNPGILKLPVEDIYQGGNSKSRNPRMQTMLRMIGFGDNAGSGFPAILSVWEKEGWARPELKEDTRLNQVVLTLTMLDVTKPDSKNKEKMLKRLAAYMENAIPHDLEKVAKKAGEKKVAKKAGEKKVAKKAGEKKVAKKSGEKKVAKKTLENQMLILEHMKHGEWYKASDFETIVSVKESRIKELLKDLIEQGKIESIGSTKGKMYSKSEGDLTIDRLPHH